MSRLAVVESDASGLRAALSIDRRLEAIEIDRTARPTLVGSIMHAKLVRRLKGLGDIVRLSDGAQALLERQGQSAESVLTVQILRDARGEKLPLASRSIALVGRALIHLPLEDGIRASRRLDLPVERRAVLEAGLQGRSGGWILRSGAASIGDDDWVAEIEALMGEGVEVVSHSARPPPNAVQRLLVDHGLPAPDAIQVSGTAAEHAVRRWCGAFAPSLLKRVERRSAPTSLFDLYDLDSAIEALALPKVALPGGGSIVIERTEALTAVDVNSGAEANPLAVNLAAAAEISRQLRLRHIGGIVVIDFISLARRSDRAHTEAALAAALAQEPTRTQILPMSKLGLVELSREHRGPDFLP